MIGTFQQIALSEIGDTIGTPPTERLAASIKGIGVVQPVLLAVDDGTVNARRYRIVDGNRRIASARIARLDTVPAVVLSDLSADDLAQCTLIANGYRASNVLTEFWAIKQLQRSGIAIDRIQRTTGFSASTIQNRDQLSRLHRALLVGLRNGRINQTIAIAVSKMTRERQNQLATRFASRGRLLRSDLEAVSGPPIRLVKPDSVSAPPVFIRYA